MVSWMEQQGELEDLSKDLPQESEERESMREIHTGEEEHLYTALSTREERGHKDEGTTSENEEWEEEDEGSVSLDVPSADGPSLLAPPGLDWDEPCETLKGSSGSDGHNNCGSQLEKPTRARRPWAICRSRLDYRCVGAATPRFFDCPDCEKRFTLSSHLIRHQRVHTGEKPFGCHSCPKSFSQRSDLVRHERMHAGVKLYRCTQCEKSFSESSHLIRHQLIHSGEKPFKCDICGKCYGDSSYLAVHQRAHTGARPYCCARCGKSFGRSSTLIRHQRVHGDPTPAPGDKPRPRGIWTAFACLQGRKTGDSKHLLSPQRSPTSAGPSLASSMLSLPLPPPSCLDAHSMRIVGWQWGLE